MTSKTSSAISDRVGAGIASSAASEKSFTYLFAFRPTDRRNAGSDSEKYCTDTHKVDFKFGTLSSLVEDLLAFVL